MLLYWVTLVHLGELLLVHVLVHGHHMAHRLLHLLLAHITGKLIVLISGALSLIDRDGNIVCVLLSITILFFLVIDGHLVMELVLHN